jgi:hypothetical protein
VKLYKQLINLDNVSLTNLRISMADIVLADKVNCNTLNWEHLIKCREKKLSEI